MVVASGESLFDGCLSRLHDTSSLILHNVTVSSSSADLVNVRTHINAVSNYLHQPSSMENVSFIGLHADSYLIYLDDTHLYVDGGHFTHCHSGEYTAWVSVTDECMAYIRSEASLH